MGFVSQGEEQRCDHEEKGVLKKEEEVLLLQLEWEWQTEREAEIRTDQISRGWERNCVGGTETKKRGVLAQRQKNTDILKPSRKIRTTRSK